MDFCVKCAQAAMSWLVRPSLMFFIQTYYTQCRKEQSCQATALLLDKVSEAGGGPKRAGGSFQECLFSTTHTSPAQSAPYMASASKHYPGEHPAQVDNVKGQRYSNKSCRTVVEYVTASLAGMMEH